MRCTPLIISPFILAMIWAVPAPGQSVLGRALQGAKTADLRGKYQTLRQGRVKLSYDFADELQLLDFTVSDKNAFRIDQGSQLLNVRSSKDNNFLFFREEFTNLCEIEAVMRPVGENSPSVAVVLLAKETKPYPAPAYYAWIRNGIDQGGHALEVGRSGVSRLQVQQQALTQVKAENVMVPNAPNGYIIYARREGNHFIVKVNGSIIMEGRDPQNLYERGYLGLVCNAGEIQIASLWVAGHLKRIE